MKNLYNMIPLNGQNTPILHEWKLGKCDYCLTSLAHFHCHYPSSIVNNTPLFPSHANSSLFCLFSLTSDQAGKNRPVALLLKQIRPWRRRERGKQLLTLSWAACFVSPWKRQGGGRKEEERKGRTRQLFFTKAICKSLALGGEQLLCIRDQHRVAELKLSGPWLD